MPTADRHHCLPIQQPTTPFADSQTASQKRPKRAMRRRRHAALQLIDDEDDAMRCNKSPFKSYLNHGMTSFISIPRRQGINAPNNVGKTNTEHSIECRLWMVVAVMVKDHATRQRRKGSKISGYNCPSSKAVTKMTAFASFFDRQETATESFVLSESIYHISPSRLSSINTLSLHLQYP